jgi:DNA polymerase-3 subunit alpha
MTDQQPPFVHLRVHSAYSLLEGALTIPHLVTLAAEQRMPALALTDTNNLFGALEFSESLAQARIQPIVGCTLSLSFAPEAETQPENGELRRHVNHGRVALLAKDAAGYANLIKLSTEAYSYGADSGDPLVTISHLALHQAGLIALTGGPDGVIDRAIAANDFRFAETALNQLKSIFGDRLYVELQRHGLAAGEGG